MEFNEKIDLFMKDNNYKNLKQFSLDCNIPYTTMRDFYEKKSVDNSRLSTIRKLSKFMKCTMDYLAYDDIIDPNQIKISGIELNNNENFNIKKADNYNNNFDKFELLFDKNKDILTEDDKEYIKFIIEKRKKEIDQQLGEE